MLNSHYTIRRDEPDSTSRWCFSCYKHLQAKEKQNNPISDAKKESIGSRFTVLLPQVSTQALTVAKAVSKAVAKALAKALASESRWDSQEALRSTRFEMI